MRTSLNELKAIDEHLFRLAPAEDTFLFELKLILDVDLRAKVLQQQQVHTLIQYYGRKTLKAEIEAVHQQLFEDIKPNSFAARVLNLFR